MSSQSRTIRRVALLTLGCKLNQADSEAIARDLAAAGCQVVDRPAADADAFIINTCSVTHVADRKGRHLARLARRLSPGAPVIVTGCSAETAALGFPPEPNPPSVELAAADLILRNEEKPSIADRLLAGSPDRRLPGQAGLDARAASTLRTRAFVRVQEGCNDVCAFCVVPRTRGRERSVPFDEVLSDVLAREREGVQEVVLTGTQLGAYGRNGSGDSGPAVLLQTLLAETTVPRLRLSSLQPQDITAELLSLWEDRRMCRHFHLALQSGSDAVLSRMRRRYTADGFRRALALIGGRFRDAAVTTDVIVGFPGETDADLEETYTLCREAGFARLHVFPYSRRPGTGADRMGDQVPDPVKRARTRALLALGQDLRLGFARRYRGQVMPVLWERARGAGGGRVWEGLTDNYLRVFTRSDADLRNRILPVRLEEAAHSGGPGEVDGGLWGDLVETPPAYQD